MALEHWRALKGVFYSLLISGLMIYAVERGADWRVFVSTVAVIGVVTTVELKEVEILDRLSVTFFRDRLPKDDSEGDG